MHKSLHVFCACLLNTASFVLLPNKRFEHGLLHDGRLLLPDSKSFSLRTVFEDSIATCLTVAVRDDHAEIMVFRVAACVFLFDHAEF